MLKQGAQVTVVNRDKERYCELQRCIPEQFQHNLSSVLGDVTSEKGAKDIFEKSTELGPIEHVVISIKGKQLWWQCGHLVDQSKAQFYNVMKEDLTGHFLLMKHFLPYLANTIGTSYTVVTGYPGSCDKARATPSSRMALSAGMLSGLVDGARADFQESRVAVSEFKIQCLVHDKEDLQICARGAQNLGNDLVGQAVTACVARRSREKVIINEREDAQTLAKTKSQPCVAQETFTNTPTKDEISTGA